MITFLPPTGRFTVFEAMAAMFPQGTAILFILPDILINTLMADRRNTVFATPSGNLFRRPLFPAQISGYPAFHFRGKFRFCLKRSFCSSTYNCAGPGEYPRLEVFRFNSLPMTDLSFPVAIQTAFFVNPACSIREIVYLCSRVKCFLFFSQTPFGACPERSFFLTLVAFTI